jgi:hypothetical protein
MIMKKLQKTIVLIMASLGLMLIASCSKVSVASPFGSWTYGGSSYQAVYCTIDSSIPSLTASNTISGSTYSDIAVIFYDSLPTVADSFTVIYAGSAPGPRQVVVNVGYMASGVLTYYGSTGGDGIHQKVWVSRPHGKLTVSGTNIEIMANTSPPDSTALNFTLTQQ